MLLVAAAFTKDAIYVSVISVAVPRVVVSDGEMIYVPFVSVALSNMLANRVFAVCEFQTSNCGMPNVHVLFPPAVGGMI